ncbi:calcium/sodium antiporter [Acuticoccus sp. I52.16.1]|uniref:calcium/sodium antiporter n=1 Tax=Acuticoccus sp. I52.16.1 TaxID=2928472 RepID=UPI001FD29DC1|nr:calcium/sodium antiporter [Acuticoccus sp. I52.16.1]UOM36109.1 calcium/sodium antiporter [Acuticoccus sp. I52.16.1]
MTLALSIVGGLFGLFVGGELLVRGASGVAVRFGMSPLVVGVVIVGFGTSAPELVTCVAAALRGSPGIAVGNIVGSNIANILLILGAAALMRPFLTSRTAVLRDGSLVIVTAVAFMGVAMTGEFTRLAGSVFVIALICYIVYTIRSDRKSAAKAQEVPAEAGTPFGLSLLFVALGLAGVIIGAEYLVSGSVELAERYGVSEEVIGLTMVAVGTSLPELATSIIAALRKQSEIALGNVLGSNVYNTIGIGGLTAVVQPVPVSPGMQAFDIPLMVAISVLLVIVVATGQRVTRWEGGLLVLLYAGYIAFQTTMGGTT